MCDVGNGSRATRVSVEGTVASSSQQRERLGGEMKRGETKLCCRSLDAEVAQIVQRERRLLVHAPNSKTPKGARFVCTQHRRRRRLTSLCRIIVASSPPTSSELFPIVKVSLRSGSCRPQFALNSPMSKISIHILKTNQSSCTQPCQNVTTGKKKYVLLTRKLKTLACYIQYGNGVCHPQQAIAAASSQF